MTNRTNRPKARREIIAAQDLQDAKALLPVNPLIVEALTAYYSNPDAYPVREVMARKVHIPAGYDPTPEGLAIMRQIFPERRRANATAHPIAVVETPDGRLWTYDDVHLVATYHDLAAGALVRVVIVARNETPEPQA